MKYYDENCKSINKIIRVLRSIGFVLALVTIVFIDKIIADYKIMIVTETVLVIFIVLVSTISLVSNLLLIKKDKSNKKDNYRKNLIIYRKITTTLFEMFATMSFLMYDCNYDVPYIVLAAGTFVSAIASFVLWYIYRADLSKDNIVENSIDYRLIDINFDGLDNETNSNKD